MSESPRPESLRQRMTWLHTWCGLLCGWLLCGIFLTGTLSVFRDSITRWMQAAPIAAPAALAAQTVGQVAAWQAAARQGAGQAAAQEAALRMAERYLARAAPDAASWQIGLPAGPEDALRLGSRGRDRVWSPEILLDPRTGDRLSAAPLRMTEGGRFFMSFHYSLQGGLTGYWIVGFVSMGMMAALVSGVIIHARIFKDFFTFRTGKGQRSWLDAHNACAVLALPFLFMIVYTGLAYFYTSYLPWPLRTVYGSEGRPHDRFKAELSAPAAPPLRRARSGEAAAFPALAPMVEKARALTGRPVARVIVEHPGDRRALVRMVSLPPDTGTSRQVLNAASEVVFDGATAEVLQFVDPDTRSAGDVHRVVEALHVASFGGWAVKWLYFVSGLAGTAMMATGTVLFAVKRRQKSGRRPGRESAGATDRAHRLVDVLNVAAIAGCALASLAYLIGNRLLALDAPDRAAWEIRIFFLVWLATLIHAGCRPRHRAWFEQWLALGVACLMLPAVNHWSTGQNLWRYLAHGDGERAAVELTVIGFGLAAAFAAWRTRPGAASAPGGRRPVRGEPRSA